MLGHDKWFAASAGVVVLVVEPTTAVKRADIGQPPKQLAQDLGDSGEQ